jgi:hypothetical protein
VGATCWVAREEVAPGYAEQAEETERIQSQRTQGSRGPQGLPRVAASIAIPEITSRAGDGGDSRSLSLFLTYGRFRTIIMGDLT